jgi:hypothetical protein
MALDLLASLKGEQLDKNTVFGVFQMVWKGNTWSLDIFFLVLNGDVDEAKLCWIMLEWE